MFIATRILLGSVEISPTPKRIVKAKRKESTLVETMDPGCSRAIIGALYVTIYSRLLFVSDFLALFPARALPLFRRRPSAMITSRKYKICLIYFDLYFLPFAVVISSLDRISENLSPIIIKF